MPHAHESARTRRRALDGSALRRVRVCAMYASCAMRHTRCHVQRRRPFGPRVQELMFSARPKPTAARRAPRISARRRRVRVRPSPSACRTVAVTHLRTRRAAASPILQTRSTSCSTPPCRAPPALSRSRCAPVRADPRTAHARGCVHVCSRVCACVYVCVHTHVGT